jgi:hypothetical protein
MQDQSIERQREGQGSGDPSGLQIQYGAIDVPGGFDSHTFPPFPYLVIFSIYYDYPEIYLLMLAI